MYLNSSRWAKLVLAQRINNDGLDLLNKFILVYLPGLPETASLWAHSLQLICSHKNVYVWSKIGASESHEILGGNYKFKVKLESSSSSRCSARESYQGFLAMQKSFWKKLKHYSLVLRDPLHKFTNLDLIWLAKIWNFPIIVAFIFLKSSDMIFLFT